MESGTPRVSIEKYDSDSFIVTPLGYDEGVRDRMSTVTGRRWDKKGRFWLVPATAQMLDRLHALFGRTMTCLDPSLGRTAVVRDRMRRELVSRRYSPETVRSYLRHNDDLLRFACCGADEVDNEEVRRYLTHLVENRNVSASTLNQAISALRFQYGRIMGRKFMYDVERPRKDRRLPVVLSRDEVARLLAVTRTPKHRTALALIYSSGLRVSEAVGLRPEDIDPERHCILVRSGKGRKDRYTPLSVYALALLRDYVRAYQPDAWLFPGRDGAHLTERSVQRAFKLSLQRAGIGKRASVHCLRHSFATHLLEDGVDLRYIQEILGHKSSRTTEIYTHVARSDILKITSPLDRFMTSIEEQRTDTKGDAGS
ncbi:MAG: tyrosine-type recombinase/integrase [Methanopyri archaeon]|nr:tyrosine-type recombinase/integrase [Methanopyri archaeon]